MRSAKNVFSTILGLIILGTAFWTENVFLGLVGVGILIYFVPELLDKEEEEEENTPPYRLGELEYIGGIPIGTEVHTNNLVLFYQGAEGDILLFKTVGGTTLAFSERYIRNNNTFIVV